VDLVIYLELLDKTLQKGDMKMCEDKVKRLALILLYIVGFFRMLDVFISWEKDLKKLEKR